MFEYNILGNLDKLKSFLSVSLQAELCACVFFRALQIPDGSYLDGDFDS